MPMKQNCKVYSPSLCGLVSQSCERVPEDKLINAEKEVVEVQNQQLLTDIQETTLLTSGSDVDTARAEAKVIQQVPALINV